MDPRLLRYYNQELQHLREMGAEFAQQFPKIAGRLRMEGVEVADPYVEQLLEGFAFLTARIQLKLDAEFPRFTQRLLEIVYPNFLAPTPAMLVAQLQPDLADAGLAAGATLPRGSMLRSATGRAGQTACRFRTGHDVTLWPLEITEAAYFTHATQLPLASLPEWRAYGGGVRLKLRATAGLDFSQIAMDDLRVHCAGIDDIAYRLHESVCGHLLGALVMPAGAQAGRANGRERFRTLDPDDVRTVGFEPEHALLPSALPGFDGYRLMQEYFAFPQRFLFFDLCGLGAALRELGGQEAEIVLLFARGDTALQQSVDAGCFALHCVPAINLFEQRCDRIHVGPQTSDFHVVVDRARPMDYEVHDILDVTGYGVGAHSERRFMPLYAAFHTADREHDAYYAMQREPRLLSTTQKRDGPRSSYIGSEVFISVVDAREAPYGGSLQQLGVKALCSNRDLPLLLPVGAELTLETTAPVKGVRVLKGPSRPLSALREGNVAWRFINQLSLNHLSLLDTDAEQGAAALREMLRLYVHEADAAQHKQVEGLRSVRTEPVVRRLPLPGPIAFGRGVRIELEVDELAFQGSSAFLLGCVLERFLARHVSMNGFTETHVRSATRGVILAGRPTCGTRPVL
ncbi:type VI secretion system baseplate subunit TssF [Aquincola sp. MAHUQ-54]|uniref:Type VI secretion system baseplate subunit TssF n=1 Tax=Aquincola agrisoli TaxID=3119538 RepID=A0AAW9QFI1_9BURK